MYLLILSLLFLSGALTFLVRKLALKKNMVDAVNERSSHTVPTPRGGGLAIVITWYLGLAFLFFTQKIDPQLFYALMSGSLLALVSFIDDLFDIKPGIRLLTQSLAAMAALFFLGGFHLIPDYNNALVFWSLNVVIFIGFIWFINLYNFLDGLDGYASQEAILVLTGIFAITLNSITLILIASVAGFLIWNWPKAKIFMGDVGSTQLGFALVVLGIWFHNTAELNIVNWLILTSLFWFDATLTLFRRWKNKEKLSVAHKKHAYQRLVQGGFSHLKVDLWAISLNILLIALIALNHFIIHQGIVLLVLVIALLFLLNKRVDGIFAFKKD